MNGLLLPLGMLVGKSYFWFKLGTTCYIRSPNFPESIMYEVPCKLVEDPTVKKDEVQDFLDQCEWDKKCIRQFVNNTRVGPIRG